MSIEQEIQDSKLDLVKELLEKLEAAERFIWQEGYLPSQVVPGIDKAIARARGES